MQIDFTPIFAWFAKILIVAGGGAAAAYGIFVFLGSKWLENRFQARLEALKHEQAKELAAFQQRMNAHLDRATKLHQHEFEVLPTAWQKLADAFSACRAIAHGFQIFVNPDIMNSDELERWLARQELEDWQKAELRKDRNKSKYFARAMAYRDLNRAETLRYDSFRFLASNGVFLTAELKDKFDHINLMLNEVISEREVNLSDPGQKPLRDGANRLNKDGVVAFAELERAVRQRLRDSADHPSD